MNDLLFTALTLVTLYYFLYYLPNQEKTNQPLSISKAVQTDPLTDEKEKEVAELKTELKNKQKDYQQKLREKDNQITKLQTEIRELVKRPLKPTNSKGIQTDSETELTNSLDTLIKNIQALNNSLE